MKNYITKPPRSQKARKAALLPLETVRSLERLAWLNRKWNRGELSSESELSERILLMVRHSLLLLQRLAQKGASV